MMSNRNMLHYQQEEALAGASFCDKKRSMPRFVRLVVGRGAEFGTRLIASALRRAGASDIRWYIAAHKGEIVRLTICEK